MASDLSFVQYAVEQLRDIPDVSYRKMFGDYMVYAGGVPVMLVCDNNCYVKILPETTSILEDAERGYPYDGAKLHYLLDIDDAEKSAEVIRLLSQILPPPKRKKKI